MRFSASARLLRTLAVLSFCSVAVFACGKLGEKKGADRTMGQGDNMGCFDQLGDRVNRYFNGNIEEEEWLETFKCVKDQVTYFRKFVRGEVSGGYTQPDIASLIRKFLIVNRPVSDAFVASLFDLKDSVFGGKIGVITHEDLDEFLKLNEVLRVETVKLLPLLKARYRNPSGDNLLNLADGVGKFGEGLATYLGKRHGVLDVSKESFIPFVREILTINGGDATLVDRYGDFMRNLKVVIAGGSPEVIEKSAWKTLMSEGATFGGLLLAYRDMEDQNFAFGEDQDQFMLELAHRAKKALYGVIARHGKGIPMELFDPVIDTLPWDSLTDAHRAALKKDLPAIVFRTLKAQIKGRLTTAAVGNALDLYESGMRSQMHVKRIYRGLPENTQRKEFEIAARKYMDIQYRDALARRVPTEEAKALRNEIAAIIEISKNFVGLFPEGSGQLVFTNAMRETRTRNHMIRMNWFSHVIHYLFGVYATGPETSAKKEKAALTTDLANLTDDGIDILRAWKLAHPDIQSLEMATKRFREANLFMPNSNGDSMVDILEGTYYIAFLFSSGSFSGKILTTIVDEWRACPITGVDELGQDAMAAECFRKNYFGHPEIFWRDFPGLQSAYDKMSESEKSVLKLSMEQAARRTGVSEKPIGPYDIDSFAALPHYVEDMMERFDADDNEMLDRDEILTRAFPIFRETLSVYSNAEWIQKGILTYIVRYGKAPTNNAKLLLWSALIKAGKKIEAKRHDVYRIVAILASPLTPPKASSEDAPWPFDE